MNDAIWVFGYGSLVWRPDMPFLHREPATLTGWVRRFWQGSPDHRGTPDQPGRVATLMPDASGHCVGMAYAIAPDVAQGVLHALDHRERAGFERLDLDVHLHEAQRGQRALVYRAAPHNPSFLGDAPLDEMGRAIAAAAGDSGPNAVYVLRLADALDALGAQDPHVLAVATSVRRHL